MPLFGQYNSSSHLVINQVGEAPRIDAEQLLLDRVVRGLAHLPQIGVFAYVSQWNSLLFFSLSSTGSPGNEKERDILEYSSAARGPGRKAQKGVAIKLWLITVQAAYLVGRLRRVREPTSEACGKKLRPATS